MGVGTRIRQKREAQGLSLSELARLADVSKGYLWELEQSDEREGEKRPSASTLFKLATALGTTVADLLHGDSSEAAMDQDVPDSLREFAKKAKLPDSEVRMLAGIRYRGDAPRTAEDWEFIYESIRRSVLKR